MTVGRPGSPSVTVVVAGGAGPSAELGASLRSVRSQTLTALEILVVAVDDAGPDAREAAVQAAEDDRIRLVGGQVGDRATAMNEAARIARGRYLTFLDPGDRLPPASLARAVNVLDESGSDFSFGRMVTAGHRRYTVADLDDPAHDRTRTGVDAASFPMAVTNLHDPCRVYRASFWHSAGLAFGSDDQPSPALTSLIRAGAFDVSAQVSCERVPATPPGALPAVLDGLDRWVARQRGVLRFLEDRGLAELRAAWAFGVCDVDATPFLDGAERATDGQWETLRRLLTLARGTVSAEGWATVRAESRVKVWLAVHGHRRHLEQFVIDRFFEFGNRPTEVDRGRVLARFGALASVPDLPTECLEMSRRETPLVVHLQSVRWAGQDRLELLLFVHAAFVGCEEEAPRIEASLVNEQTGESISLPVHADLDHRANVHARHRYQDYSRAACRVVVDPSSIPTPDQAQPPARWSFVVDVSYRGLGFRGGITSQDPRSSPGLLGHPEQAPRTVAGRHVALRPAGRTSVVLDVAPAPPVEVAELRSRGRTVSGVLRGRPSGSVVAMRRGKVAVRAPVRRPWWGAATFALTMPAPRTGAAPAVRHWKLRLESSDGESHALAAAGAGVVVADDTEGAAVVLGRDKAGHLEVVEGAPSLLLTGIDLEDRALRVRGQWTGKVPEAWQVALVGARGRAPVRGPVTEPVSGTARTAALDTAVPLTWDEWGLGRTCIPPASYDLTVTVLGRDRRREAVRVLLDEDVVAALSLPTVSPDFRWTPVHRDGGLAVRLEAPLQHDEVAPSAQHRLLQWSSGETLTVDPGAVYLQSYTGSTATDSPRAIHEELRHSRPDLRLYWGVDSSSTQLPEGGIPVLIGSRAWHRVRGSAKYLVTNVDLGRGFATRPGQRYLQTFHGYPAKSMGIGLWGLKGYTPLHIVHELERTSRDWDLILTPCPEMDGYYRSEYAYDGDIESGGYPRDDALVAPDAPAVRDRTRRLLGIREDQTAVLYAPTWRDDQATGPRSAELTSHLDLEAATRRLGEDHVFLMRGHRFHLAARQRQPGTARLLDVTRYPEVNDLVLAADVAVLDYSSLRFDFALTGRPMLFLVPDLEAYTGGVRGFLYPFEDSAPGPLLRDADEVVAALLRLPAVAAEHAEDYDRFNRTYNYRQDGRSAQRVVARFFD